MNLNKKSVMAKLAGEILDLKYVYCYGAKYTGTPITAAKIKTLRDNNSQVYTPEYYQKTLTKCVGKYAIDCSGLVCHVWGISDIGSYQIAELPDSNPTLFTKTAYTATAKLEPFDCLWKPGHVGLASVDTNYTIEARSLDAGVGMFKKTDHDWKSIIHPLAPAEEDGRSVGWYHEPDGTWWYSTGTHEGQYYRNTVAEINNELYMFDADGWLVVSPIITFNDNGSIRKIEGERYKS